MYTAYSFKFAKKIAAAIFILFLSMGIMTERSNAYIVGTSPFEPLIFIFNDPSWTVFSQDTLTLSGFTVLGANSVSYNPVDGQYYAILRVSVGTRRLVTVDPETGVCTDIGAMGSNYSSMTFTPSGKLYAFGGHGSGVTAERLYSVNTANGTTTLLAGPFSLGADGEVIAFNPDDGFIYHWSGNTTANMARIDTSTFVETVIAQSGAPHAEIFGAAYKGGGEFYLTDIASRSLTMTTGGLATLVATGLPDDIRGLGYGDAVLPVELASFTSSISGRDVTLNWTTSSESNNSGFEIQRASGIGQFTRIAFVGGNGTSSSANSYSFTDRSVNSGTYSYRLKQTDFNGNFEYFNLSNEVVIGIPGKFDLSQNYPNPFNPSTKINFDVPVDSRVNIKLLDISGREVALLANEVKAAGYYTLEFNASELPSGVYFYRIVADGNGKSFTATKKMTLIK